MLRHHSDTNPFCSRRNSRWETTRLVRKPARTSQALCGTSRRVWYDYDVTVLDKLTYAGNTDNLKSVWDNPRFRFIHGDICSGETVRVAMTGHSHVINFAAETHVDRSILDSGDFVRTDVEGTRVLLEEARRTGLERYLQVSTDEVYGDMAAPSRALEDTSLRPRSPYSASKAGGDLLVGAYHMTYNVPTLITRGSNTYGPYQYPEN
jgi:dTDP-glucose 4,6-dehydratase